MGLKGIINCTKTGLDKKNYKDNMIIRMIINKIKVSFKVYKTF